ncbi:MAG: sensor histidine kinase [Lachnospiraceae bacterium]|nr:sensor histidine kinase [Lachnospiraceae bacterium]
MITEKERREYEIRESENVIRTLSSNIYSELKNYMELSRLIMMEDRLVKFLRANAESVDTGMINDARYGIKYILNVTEGVDSVMVMRNDYIMAKTNSYSYRIDYMRLGDDDWKEKILEKKGKAIIELNGGGITPRSDNKAVISIERAIYDILTQKQTGILFMNISDSVFDIMLKQLKFENICIMGDDGTYIAGNRDYMAYYDERYATNTIFHDSVKEGNERLIVSGCRVENTPIIILRVGLFGTAGIPYNILYVLCVLLIIYVIGMTFVGTFVTRNITKPVYELSKSMEINKQSGELKPIEKEIPEGELNMLKNDYNSLIEHVNELIATLIDKEKNLQKAEMRVLQEQIKPHFLYNSIETIGFMALDAGANNVHDALETLGSFYRNFLSKGGREIPLSREICIVKDYISLQKLRYGDIIEEEFDIDPDTENVVVPKLILQPLVENSIYHGIRLKGEKGLIKISSRLEDGILHLTVRDTGVGMSEEQVEGFFSSNETDTEKVSDSFGLRGTIERIKIYCGSEDIVKIRSELGEYTEIEFLIKDNHVGDR